MVTVVDYGHNTYSLRIDKIEKEIMVAGLIKNRELYDRYFTSEQSPAGTVEQIIRQNGADYLKVFS